MKAEQVVATLVAVSLLCTVLFLSGHLMTVFFAVMGQETYQITLEVQLYPVLNNREELIDVDVRFESSLRTVRVPHEVVWDTAWGKIDKSSYGERLFRDVDGSFSLGLNMKLENFTNTLFTHYESIDIPMNHVFTIYCFLKDAQSHGVLQLTVEANKELRLNNLRNPITEEWNYVEKFEV